jgi:hypothetical protein
MKAHASSPLVDVSPSGSLLAFLGYSNTKYELSHKFFKHKLVDIV